MSDVIDLFAERKPKDEAEKKDEAQISFEEEMARNKQNEERLRKERLKANKSVLRSYRIKN